jgi:hypothetical protein
MTSKIKSDSFLYSNLDNTRVEVIELPFDANRIEVVSDDITTTGIWKLSGDLSAEKCTKLTNSATGTIASAVNYINAKIYFKPQTIAGAFTVSGGDLIFTPTNASDTALFYIDAYVSGNVTENQAPAKAVVGDIPRFVQSLTGTAINLGIAHIGSGAGTISGNIILHSRYAGLDFNFSSEFSIQSKSGDKIVVKGIFPIETLSKSLTIPGALRITITPLSAINTGVKSRSSKSSIGISFPIDSVDIASKTFILIDEKGLLNATGRFYGNITAQGGFASVIFNNLFFGQDIEGVNSLSIGIEAVASASKQYHVVIYSDREITNN